MVTSKETAPAPWDRRDAPSPRHLTVTAAPGQEPLSCELICEPASAHELRGEWDELAAAAGVPMMAPACIEAWWQTLAPARSEARIVAVRCAGQLVGVAPFYCEPNSVTKRHLGLRLPGIELAGRLAPLASPGREGSVANALASTLRELAPNTPAITLEGTSTRPDWAGGLREGWPEPGTVLRRFRADRSPTLTLTDDSFEHWLESKSANFRSGMRRMRRKFAQAGGTSRQATMQTLRDDVELFVALHAARWQGRGSSRLLRLGSRLGELLIEIGRQLLADDGRFRLRVLELDGQPVTAQLFIAAGGRAQYINGGWDERFARFKPPMLAILDVIEDAFARGDRLIDLGTGAQSYKLRFADGIEQLSWAMLLPPGPRVSRRLLATVPMRGQARLASAVKARLTEEQLARYLRLRERAWTLERRAQRAIGEHFAPARGHDR